jgi:hypothetical protein
MPEIDEAEGVSDGAPTQLDLGAATENIRRRAEKCGWEFMVGALGEDDDDPYIVIRFPNGRSIREITLDEDGILALANTPFENYRILGEYDAIIDTSTGSIEAALVSRSGQLRRPALLWRLPGAEILDNKGEYSSQVDASDTVMRSRPEKWRIVVTDGPRRIEISPASDAVTHLLSSGFSTTSIKLSGYETTDQESALNTLRSVSNAFLFDLDLCYNVSVELRRLRRFSSKYARVPVQQPPKFPHNNYAEAPLELYRYGRTSAGLPLLQYLAFYQSIEYFFPTFTREDISKRIRAELVDPRFDPTSDQSLTRLISLAAPAAGTPMKERDQLRTAVRACVDVPALSEFIGSSEVYTQHFCDKKQAIKGVLPLQLKGSQTDLRDQVADRVYAIRCRIVHTKQDGGPSGVDLLLPASKEANSLPADVDLVRFLAQRALVTRATRT